MESEKNKLKNQVFLYEFCDLFTLYIQPLDIFGPCQHIFMLKQRFPIFMGSCAYYENSTIYYTGGQSESGSFKLCMEIKIDFETLKITETLKEKMLHAHYGHAVIPLNSEEFMVISGFDHEHKSTKRCEKYVTVINKWVELASIKTARGFLGACLFDQQFVYTFGGSLDPAKHEGCDKIECYRTLQDKWETINLLFSQGWGPRISLASYQLDEDSMIVFGGIGNFKENLEIPALEFLPSSSAIRKISVLESSDLTDPNGSFCCVNYEGFIYCLVNRACLIYDIKTRIWKKKLFLT